MRIVIMVLGAAVLWLLGGVDPALAQAPVPEACVAIDETRDTLTPSDRVSALAVLASQFENEGWQVVAPGCADSYTVWHVRFGDSIFVVLEGGGQRRDGTARSFAELPSVYRRLIRAIAPRAMTMPAEGAAPGVVLGPPVPVRKPSPYKYVRLGYGALLGNRAYGVPGFGLGVRSTIDAVALDISFLNVQFNQLASSAGTFSFVKMQLLRDLDPGTGGGPYVGGGVSLGTQHFDSGSQRDGVRHRSWSGSGLQGELTAGFSRKRSALVFVEVNATLPFYRAVAQGVVPDGAPRAGSVYAPSLQISLGLGWPGRVW